VTSRLPSLRAVAIFVAAGRALSFTEAAKAVHLTPSAVSRRIRASWARRCSAASTAASS
jgi:predicted transcriptional regulator